MARRFLDKEIDPSEYRQSQKESLKEAAANSFESVAREWFAIQEPNWAPSHSSKVIARLENDVFPWIGKKPIGRITAPQLLKVTEPVAVGRLLRQIDACEGSYIVRAALHLAPLVFVRPGELRRARWADYLDRLAAREIGDSHSDAGRY